MSDKIIDMLAVTAEAMQVNLSENALLIISEDLAAYSDNQIGDALKRLRRESRRLTIADIIERIDDGRPLPEMAWGMVPKSESESVVWCEEMAAAYAAAIPMIEIGDKIAARMAFMETYKNELMTARSMGKPVKWSASLGEDHKGREDALRIAIEKRRISKTHAIGLLPSSSPAFRVEAGGRKLLAAADGIAEEHIGSAAMQALASEIVGGRKEYTNAAVNQKPTDEEIARLSDGV